jgi:O-antigen ligase
MNTPERGTPFGFLAAVLTVPVVFMPAATDPFSLSRWLLLGILAALYAALKGSRAFSVPAWKPVHFLLLYLFVFSAIHALANPSFPAAAHALMVTALWLLCAAFASASPEAARKTMAWMALLGAVEAIYGLFQFAGYDPLFVTAAWASGPRMSMAGTIGTPSIYGIHLGLSLLAGLHCLLTSGRRILFGSLTALMAVALVFNNTRSAIVGTGLGVGWMLMRRLQRKALPVLAVAVLAAAALLMFHSGLRQRWTELLSFKQTHSATIRGFYWRVTWAAVSDKPWLGYGPGSFSRTYFDTQADLLSRKVLAPPEPLQPMLWAHNDYLQVWLEYGLPGLLLLIWVLGHAVFRCVRRGRVGTEIENPASSGILLGAFSALFLFPLYHPSTLVPLLYYLALATGQEAPTAPDAAEE